MNTIEIFNTKTNTTDRFENRNLDCCLQALTNLGYQITSHHDQNLHLAGRDGQTQFVIQAL